MLSRQEIQQRLAVLPPFDEGQPQAWPEMGMEATRCTCGRWLQVVRPGKWQCQCQYPEVWAQDAEREALETARRLAEWVYWLTQNCRTCPHAIGPGAPTCEIPHGDDRPCCVAEREAETWLERDDAES